MRRGLLRARSIGSTAAAILTSSPRGTVAATYHRSSYLELGGRIVALATPDLLNGPLNIVVDAPAAFSFRDLPPDQAVTAAPGVITIGHVLRVETARAPVWNAQLPPLAAVEIPHAAARLPMIASTLAAAPDESLARPERRPRRAEEAMRMLAEGIRLGDGAIAAEAAGRLAGLGPGLTPSGDDVLVGVMIALTLVPPGGASSLRGAIHGGAAGRTTKISAAYLEAASRGEAGEAWHHLRDTLSSQGEEPSRTGACEAAVRRVLAFGETSGADMLAGLVLALRALVER